MSEIYGTPEAIREEAEKQVKLRAAIAKATAEADAPEKTKTAKK